MRRVERADGAVIFPFCGRGRTKRTFRGEFRVARR